MRAWDSEAALGRKIACAFLALSTLLPAAGADAQSIGNQKRCSLVGSSEIQAIFKKQALLRDSSSEVDLGSAGLICSYFLADFETQPNGLALVVGLDVTVWANPSEARQNMAQYGANKAREPLSGVGDQAFLWRQGPGQFDNPIELHIYVMEGRRTFDVHVGGRGEVIDLRQGQLTEFARLVLGKQW